MISALQNIAERKIEQFMKEGRGYDLISHWKNKPQPLEDDMANVPTHLRMAYRILRNAGYVPEELRLRKEINTLDSILENCTDEKMKIQQMKKLDFLRFKLESRTRKKLHVDADAPYRIKMVNNITVF